MVNFTQRGLIAESSSPKRYEALNDRNIRGTRCSSRFVSDNDIMRSCCAFVIAMKFAKIERNAKCRDTSLEKMAFVRSKVCRGKTVYRGYFLSPRFRVSRASRVSRIIPISNRTYVCTTAKEMTKNLREVLGIHAISGRSREREREIASLLAVQNPPSVALVPLTFRPLVEYLQVDIPLPENIVENELFIQDLTLG